jgi:hypothetical protein
MTPPSRAAPHRGRRPAGTRLSGCARSTRANRLGVT